MRAFVGVAIVVVGISAAPTIAAAQVRQDRLIDGAIGAGAGAIVAGPIGALAGGVIGLAVGPDIARALHLNRPRRDEEEQEGK